MILMCEALEPHMLVHVGCVRQGNDCQLAPDFAIELTALFARNMTVL